MLNPKAKRTVSKIIPARAGHSAVRFPVTVSDTRANRPTVVPKRSGETARARPCPTDAAGGGAGLAADSIKTKSGVDVNEKIRELLLLAKEQGHLTCDDINDALPESIVTPDDFD